MRITIVTHLVAPGDGQGRVNYEVAREALRRGHDLTLVAAGVESDLKAHPRTRWIQIKVRGWPTQLVRNLVFARQSTRWLTQHRDRINVLITNGCITREPADLNAAHFVHGAWLHSPYHAIRASRDLYSLYQWIYTWLNARWEKKAFDTAGRVIAVSERVRNELLRIGVPIDKIHVIPNGVDIEEFMPGFAGRVDLGIFVPESTPLGLFVGDLRTPRKNLDTTLRALQHVPHLHLVVAGDTEGSPYPKLAEDLGLRERVHFLGFRRDVAVLMRAANFVVFPSRYDPFGLVVLEALASGRPVITARTVGAAPLVDGCGIVIENPEDDMELARSMMELSSQNGGHARIGQEARRRAKQHAWSKVAAAYLDLAEEVVKQRSSASRLIPRVF